VLEAARADEREQEPFEPHASIMRAPTVAMALIRAGQRRGAIELAEILVARVTGRHMEPPLARKKLTAPT